MTQKSIGRYQIKQELGQGGMGTVYLAYDPKLEREVAVKLLPPYFAHDPESSARFDREAKTVAGLDHYAIVPVYDYGEDDIWPFFVMRLMPGGSLKERILRGPMSLAESAYVLQRVSSALDRAHKQGVVHRDVKPGNILFDNDGRSYLSDFGLVRLAEGSGEFTRTGNPLGTPAYMSPEQADNLPIIDWRSDIYSLGVVLYEMLAGLTPYASDSVARLLMMHLTEPVPNLREARPDLPQTLQNVIEQAMAKKPEARYRTAGEMAAVVRGIAGEHRTAARKPSTVKPDPGRPEREPRRPAGAPAGTAATAANGETEKDQASLLTQLQIPVAEPATGRSCWFWGCALLLIVVLVVVACSAYLLMPSIAEGLCRFVGADCGFQFTP